MNLKSYLLRFDCIQDNKYLDQYCMLIERNLNTKKIKNATQAHHIFPHCLIKLFPNTLEDNELCSSTVNLLFKDHIIAHALLVLSSSDCFFKHMNMCAVFKLLGQKQQFNFEEYVYDLNEVQAAYELSRDAAYKNNPMFDEEEKEKHDQIMKSTEVRDKISKSMKQYRSKVPFSEEHRNKISKKAQGQRFINKDGLLKHVKQEELEVYLQQGWKLGSLPVPREIVEKRAKTRCRPIKCVDKEGNLVSYFPSLSEACLWWNDRDYHRTDLKAIFRLKNDMKKSYDKNKYKKGLLWIYISKDEFNELQISKKEGK